MSPSGPSVLSSWTQSIAEFLRSRSLDPGPIFASAGLDLAELQDPNARLPLESTRRIWPAVVAATGDESCGLRISGFVRPTTFHALGFAVLASNTLQAALERLAQYGRVMTDAGSARLEERSDGVGLRIDFPDGREDVAPESMDALLSLIVRVCRLITANDFELRAAYLHRQAPAGGDQTFRRFFRVPVYFGAEYDVLVMGPECLRRQLPLANPELAAHGDHQVGKLLAQDEGKQLRARIVRIVARMMSEEVTPEDVARKLAMSVRSMQRRLGEEGTTFQELVRSTREDLARSYLKDARLTITEVAFLLGFSDPTSFARAFRRWTGFSPSAFRERGP